VGLGSKGAGSWEVSVTTLQSQRWCGETISAHLPSKPTFRSHSIVAVQHAFRTGYQIPPQDRVPDQKSILLWVENFRETVNVSEKR